VGAGSAGVVYILDECWKILGSRSWASTATGLLCYLNQHRHFGDDVYLCSQHWKQIETAARQVVQDWSVCRNHGLERAWMFRRPALFCVDTYYDIPSGAPGQVAQYSITYRMDRLLGGTYDTSAGVGHVGGMGADVVVPKKGLHWGYMAGGIFLVFLLILLGPTYIMPKLVKGASGALMKSTPVPKGATVPVTNAVPDTTSTGRPVVPGSRASQEVPLMRDQSDEERKLAWFAARDQLALVKPRPVQQFAPVQSLPDDGRVWLTGVVEWNGKPTVCLSDGSTYHAGDAELELVTPKFVIISGRVYRWPKGYGQRQPKTDPPLYRPIDSQTRELRVNASETRIVPVDPEEK